MEAKSAKVEHVLQPETFEFTKANLTQAKKIIARYPKGRQQSAVMPLLTIAQRQHDNWLPRVAMDVIAGMLGMAPMRVYEVATFYSMYNMRPMGKHHVQLCTTTPCWLRGSDNIVRACEEHLGIRMGDTSNDGLFTLTEVECLGACVNAPMCQITSSEEDHFYEDLTAESIVDILKTLAAGKQPSPGSAAGRKSSEPVTGPTTLEAQQKGWEKMKKGAA